MDQVYVKAQNSIFQEIFKFHSRSNFLREIYDFTITSNPSFRPTVLDTQDAQINKYQIFKSPFFKPYEKGSKLNQIRSVIWEVIKLFILMARDSLTFLRAGLRFDWLSVEYSNLLWMNSPLWQIILTIQISVDLSYLYLCLIHFISDSCKV